MDSLATPPMLNHLLGEEIHTEDKQAIRQLYKQARFMPLHLIMLYNVGKSTINRVLRYDQITRNRPTRINRPHLLNNTQVNWIIK
jgi:hypothetical protein